MATMEQMVEVFGEPISVYTREQAIEDGMLVDMTEWGSDREVMGGFTCPVAITQALWVKVDVDSKKGHKGWSSTRGVAHDVLWMGSVAARGMVRRQRDSGDYIVKVGSRNLRLHLVMDGDGVTIGFPEDF